MLTINVYCLSDTVPTAYWINLMCHLMKYLYHICFNLVQAQVLFEELEKWFWSLTVRQYLLWLCHCIFYSYRGPSVCLSVAQFTLGLRLKLPFVFLTTKSVLINNVFLVSDKWKRIFRNTPIRCTYITNIVFFYLLKTLSIISTHLILKEVARDIHFRTRLMSQMRENQ